MLRQGWSLHHGVLLCVRLLQAQHALWFTLSNGTVPAPHLLLPCPAFFSFLPQGLSLGAPRSNHSACQTLRVCFCGARLGVEEGLAGPWKYTLWTVKIRSKENVWLWSVKAGWALLRTFEWVYSFAKQHPCLLHGESGTGQLHRLEEGSTGPPTGHSLPRIFPCPLPIKRSRLFFGSGDVCVSGIISNPEIRAGVFLHYHPSLSLVIKTSSCHWWQVRGSICSCKCPVT